ncbi:MAG TPA: YadA-like family protein [Sphingobium sp.]
MQAALTQWQTMVARPLRNARRLRRPVRTRLLGSGMAAFCSVALILSGATPAHSEVVGACAGVSLPPSVVTNIVGNVLVPVIQPLETLLGTLTLGTVDLGLSNLLSNAASGAPISLGAIDVNGGTVDLLTDPGCNSQADSFGLTTPKGLSIGGNQITGLGQNGLAASAAELDAIAIGDNAFTGVGANGAIAFGKNASVTHAGSVALGAGSVADGATLGTSAYLVGGTAAAEVNIGSRRLTGLAAGANATDAVNVAQLTVVADATAQLGYDMNALSGLAVKYQNTSQTSITLGGAGGTRISNLSAGVAAGDAVNMTQLNATNTTVTQLSYDVAALDGLAVKYQDGTRAAITLGGASGTRIGNVAAGVADTDAVNVAQLNAVSTSVSAVRDDALLYDGSKSAYSATRGGVDQRVTGVAAGTVATGSTDAINGGQLAASNAAIASHLGGGATVQADGTVSAPSYALATVGADGAAGTSTYNNVGDALGSLGTSISNVNQRVDAVAAAAARSVSYDDASHDVVTFTGANGTRLTNVQAGDVSATSTDAVNGSQLHATNSQLAANTTVINNIRTGRAGFLQVNNSSGYAEPTASGADSIAIGGGATASGDRGIALGAQAQVLAVNSVAIGHGSVADRANSVSVGSVGNERTLTNVADGVSAMDAVNVRQLQGGMGEAVSTANAYTDRRFEQMNTDLYTLRREARAGTASAMALSSIPQPIEAGRNVIGMGFSGWQGEGAIALGLSRASDNGKFMMRAGATYNSRNQGGANAGVGFAF